VIQAVSARRATVISIPATSTLKACGAPRKLAY